MNRRHFLASIPPLLGGLEGINALQLRESAAAHNAGPQEPDHAALLAQHDIIYQTPVDIGPEWLPIGNGDLVGMVWMPPDGLTIGVNKCNLWDDRTAPPPLPAEWSWAPTEEERWTALVSGARLRIRSSLPIFETIYLDDFLARLNLFQGLVEIASASPISKVRAVAWVSKEPAVMGIQYEETAREPVTHEIQLSRWGSRRLFHWYRQYDPTATSTGLDGTEAGADQDSIWIEQKLRAMSFAVAARFVGTRYRTQILDRHSAVMTTEHARDLRGTLYLAVVTSEEDPFPLRAARHKLAEAIAQGPTDLLDRHKKYWAGFWRKSYVQIPDAYLENLYYCNLYQLAASSQGDYPPPHSGGLWFWQHDARRWGHYYHWDIQQQYWPVQAANHPELARPYLDFRYRTLPQAEKYAREVHKRGGAYYADVTDRWGRETVNPSVTHNLTPSAQIAMDFWRQYQYTEDREFLRTRAYPVMKAASQFYLDTLERDAQWKYHIPLATCYENDIEQADTITDLSAIRQSFPACIRASEILGIDADLREKWAEVLRNLIDYGVINDATDDDGRVLPPVFSSGIPLVDAEAGHDPNQGIKKRPVLKGKRQFNISFRCEVAPVFPSGVVGLSQRGTKLFEVARATVEALKGGPAWNSAPIIAAARLGMARETYEPLIEMVEQYQKMPQGFLAEQVIPVEKLSDFPEMSTPRKVVDGRRTNEVGMLPRVWFFYPDLELGGILGATINEMLLQSHDGIIRVFPALPQNWHDVAFRLRAVGAFLVTGEVRRGEIQPFVVESLAGSECEIESPWAGQEITTRDLASGARLPARGSRIRFATRPGVSYLVFRLGQEERLPHAPTARHGPNRAPKEWRGCRLGIPRFF